MNTDIAAEAAGKYYDANEFFQDLGGREAFIHSLKPFIQAAIDKATAWQAGEIVKLENQIHELNHTFQAAIDKARYGEYERGFCASQRINRAAHASDERGI